MTKKEASTLLDTIQKNGGKSVPIEQAKIALKLLYGNADAVGLFLASFYDMEFPVE